MATSTEVKKPKLNIGKLSDVAKLVTSTEREIEIPLAKVTFDVNQPRKAFHHLDGRVADEDLAYIDELAASIEKNGLIQAPTMQEQSDGTYLVVVGECRTRAHLKLGRATIRAKVRNDLDSPSKRLLFQLSENVNRKDLSDDEMARSIKELMEGVNGDAPMNQSEIAKYFGKSEGWVTRYVKYGDEELQRLWVKSGIADTVEKVYRLSILPKTAQLEIFRRVELPEGDPDRLEKPLLRSVIDDLARDAKVAKLDARTAAQRPSAQPGPAVALPESAHKPVDSIQQAMAASASEAPLTSGAAAVAPLDTGGYQLEEAARQALLGSIPVAEAGDAKGDQGYVPPPVRSHVTVTNVLALIDILKANTEIVEALRLSRCELTLPGPLAKLVANELMGVVVEDQKIPATLQNELAKLK